MFNTIPNNPFPPSSASAGGGGESYTLPVASADTLGGIKVGEGLSIADGVLSVDKQVTIDIFDKYAFSSDQYGNLVVTKTHMGETTTQTIQHSGTHTIDDYFTVNDVAGWTLTLLVDSTEYPSETTWNWRYGFAPPISELTFVSERRTDTIDNFLTELYNK